MQLCQSMLGFNAYMEWLCLANLLRQLCLCYNVGVLLAILCQILFYKLTDWGFRLLSILCHKSAHAGRNSPPRDFGVHESKPTGIFDAMGAIGSIAFAFNTVVLPELQVPPSSTFCYV